MKIGIYLVILGLMMGDMGCSRVSPTKEMKTFATFNLRAQNGDQLSVVLFGGSLTWGAQATDPQRTLYRALVSERFNKTYQRAHLEPGEEFRIGSLCVAGAPSCVREMDVAAVLPEPRDAAHQRLTYNNGKQ